MRFGFRDTKNARGNTVSREYIAESDYGTIPPPPGNLMPDPNSPPGEYRLMRGEPDPSLETEGHRLARLKVSLPGEVPVDDIIAESKMPSEERSTAGTASGWSNSRTLSQQLTKSVHMPRGEAERFAKEQETTPQMFAPKPAIATDAIAHPSMKAHIVGLAALAIKDQKGNITSSPDLSEHSSKLVRKAMTLGVVKPHPANPTAEAVNDIDWSDNSADYADEFPDTSWDQSGTGIQHEVSSSDVAAAKREMLRGFGSGDTSMSPQFDSVRAHQPRLPGMS